MANIVEYLINFKSQGSNAIVRQAAQMSSRLDATTASAMRLSNAVGRNLKSAILSLPGAQFFTNPIVALTAGIGVVSKLGMQTENAAKAFSVLVGNTDQAASMLSELNSYADNTIWSRSIVLDASKTMLGFGVSAKEVTGDLMRLGDIAMGDSQKLQSLALVFGQVASAGRLQGQDLLQLINAGYNPLVDIAELTGKTVGEVKEEMSKGAISFDMVRQAIVRATSEGGRYYKMIDTLAQTESGRFEQMKGKAISTMLDLYKIVQPVLIPLFQALIDTMTVIEPIIGGVANAVGWFFKELKDGNPWLLGVITAIGAYSAAVAVNTFLLKGWKVAELAQLGAMILVEKAQWLLNIAMSANPIGLIIAGIAALTVAMIVCWKKFAGFRAVIITVWSTIKGFASLIKEYVVGSITDMLQGIGKVGEALSKLFSGDFKGAWQSVKDAGALFFRNRKGELVKGAVNLVGGIPDTYRTTIANERAKDKAKGEISSPQAAAGVDDAGSASEPSAVKDPKGIATDIATGGTRNTSINMTISNLIGSMNFSAANLKESAAEIREAVLEAVNRSIEIGLSAAR